MGVVAGVRRDIWNENVSMVVTAYVGDVEEVLPDRYCGSLRGEW